MMKAGRSSALLQGQGFRALSPHFLKDLAFTFYLTPLSIPPRLHFFFP